MSEISLKVSAWSNERMGIKGADGKWYNKAEGLDSKEVKKEMNKMCKGAFVDLVLNEEGRYTSIEITELPERNFDNITSFDDILKEAHRVFEDKLSIKTHVYRPVEDNKNLWMAKAEVIVDNRVFTGHGDADKENVTSPNVRKALPRMAETRSIKRALRHAGIHIGSDINEE